MRFSSSSILSALPLLAAAQEAAPFEQYKAQFQNFLGNFGSYIPSPNKHDPVGAAEAKIGEMKMDILTLDNWKDTLYSPVKPESTTPEEWWVLITGGNKTCFGSFACGHGVLQYLLPSVLTSPPSRPLPQGRSRFQSIGRQACPSA